MIFVFCLFTAAAVIQVLFYSLIFGKLAYSRERHYEPDAYPPVSVVICAKNEAENLKKNLKVILIQNYPTFEVIIVNDQSTDNTIEVISEYFDRNDNLRLFNIKPGEKPLPGKKFALKTGVENARYDTIVVTDADCKPFSAHWLEHLVGSYLDDTEFVLGYSPFYRAPGLLNRLARYENVMTAMQYLSFAKLGMPYMGVGRNMSFRKSMFRQWDMKKSKTNGGDDDLFVNALARGRYTELCLHKDAFTYSEAKHTWREWLRQKTRHVSTGRQYRFSHQVILFLFALSNFLFYTSFPLLFIKAAMMPLVLISLVFTVFMVLFTKYAVTSRINNKLQQGDLTKWFLIMDPAYVFYLLLIFILTIFRPNPEWK
jgi:cellulose synthase/poly-beta-1,6-N-acetylglucosamine synthase-like glycosyltransferase